MNNRLQNLQAEASDWFVSSCLPIWSDIGYDTDLGGFVEGIELNGTPAKMPRRVMVQARQIFTFCVAGELGWSGPWRDRVESGLDFMRSHFRRADGTYRHSISSDTRSVAVDRADLYSQSFVLFALAHAYQALDKPQELAVEALALWQILVADYRAPQVGFTERSGDHTVLCSNPNMHFMEANLAWLDSTGDAKWESVCKELAELCRDRLVPAKHAGLRENFAAVDWAPLTDRRGQIIEPGHQFEWAWLLVRWYRRTQDESFLELARDLVEMGERGICPNRRVPLAEILPDATPVNSVARMWPNTERLKACMGMLEIGDGNTEKHLDNAIESYRGIQIYFEGLPAGLFHDRWHQDGRFDREPARASSMYHIACSVSELNRVANILNL